MSSKLAFVGALVALVACSSDSADKPAAEAPATEPARPELAAPDCDTIGGHIIALAVRETGDKGDEAMYTRARAEIARECRDKKWPDKARLCLSQAEDRSQLAACEQPGALGKRALLGGLGPATAAPGPDTPPAAPGPDTPQPTGPTTAASEDVDCATAVANFKRVSEAEIAGQPNDVQTSSKRELATLIAKLTADCKSKPWPADARRCLARANTHEALKTCSASLLGD